MMTPRGLKRLLATTEAICESDAVTHFVIGLTANPTSRSASYRGVKIPHFVILETNLTCRQALQLEEALQTETKGHKKYHPEKRTGGHRRSVGGVKSAVVPRTYSVYLAWY